MASTAAVEIIIRAQNDASKVLDEVKGSLAELHEQASAAVIVFGAMAAAGVALIGKLTMTAARTEELGVVVANMGRVHGIAQAELDSYEQAITGMGITTQAARDMMIRMMGSQLDLADATNIARAAQDLAVIGMRDSSEATADLLYAIISLQPRLLRKYGIYVNLNTIYKEVADSLGKNVRELTELERRQGFLNATLQQAAEYTGTYESAMTTASKQLRTLPRFIQETSNAIGQYFVPMLGDAVGALTAFLEGIIALPAPVQEGIAVLLGMGTVFVATTAAIAGAVLMIPKLITALTFLTAHPLVLAIAGIAALVAGLYALSKHLESTAQANEELNRTAVATSTTYAGYLRAVEDSTTGTVILSEEVWKLADAEMALAEEADKAAIAAQAVVSQELLDTLKRYQQGAQEVAGVLAEYALNTSGVTDAEMEHVKQLILLDPALRDVAVAQGLLTQAEVDAVQAVESADRALLIVTQGLIEYTHTQEEATEATKKFGYTMEEAATIIKPGWGTLANEIAFYGKAMETDIFELIEAAKQLKEIREFAQEAYEQLAGIAQKYSTDIAKSVEDFTSQVEQGVRQHYLSLRTSEIEYQRSRAELIAQASAEIAAMETAGLSDQAAERQAKLDEDLAMLEYNYKEQKAWAAWNWEIQQLMQEQAHAQRLADTAEFAMNEAQILQAQSEAKLDALRASLIQASMYALGMIKIDAAVLMSTTDSARGQIETLQAVIEAHKAAAASFEADMNVHLAEVDRISSAIQDKIAVGPQLPEMPDFSRWVGDYSTGVSGAGSSIKESATKTLKEVTVDIAEAFEKAMETFEEVAKYDTPTGLAAGMEALRKDIQEAVRQLYIAHDAIGEEGVIAAGLIAEAANTIVSMIGEGVEAFAALTDYGQIGREKINLFIDDVYEVIQGLLKMGALWHNAGHKYEAVVEVSQRIAGACTAAVGWIKTGVEAFAALQDYVSPAQATIETFVADLQTVMDGLAEIGGGNVDEVKLAWVEFSGKLLSLVAGMIDDMETIASYKGGIGYLSVSGDKVVELVSEMGRVAGLIGYALYWDRDRYSDTAEANREMELAWLELNAGLISTLATAIEDMQALADYEGGIGRFSVSGDKIIALVSEMGRVAGLIGYALYWDRDRYDETAEATRAMELAWLELSAGLISTVVGVIEDLRTIAAYEGDVQVGFHEVQQLIWQIDVTARNILSAIEAVASDFQAEDSVDQLKAAWLDFSAGLIATVAGVIEDLRTIAAYEGDIQTSFHDVQQLVWQMDVTARNILDAIETVASDFQTEDSVDQLKAAWLEFSAGLISTVAGVIEDLRAIAAYEGGIQINTAAVGKLMGALERAADTILLAIGDAGEEFTWVTREADELKADWLELNTSLVSTLAGIIGDIEDLAAFEGVNEAAFKIGLDNLFDALYWFLAEFNRRAGLFAGVVSEEGADIAELMGRTASALGDAVQPVMDVAEFAISPAEAEVAIGLFFEALELFLEKFKEKAADFDTKVDQDTADLATIIGDTVSGIGAAVEPLIKILEYNPEVVNIDTQFEEFFGHLARALWWIEFEKGNWEVSTAAQDLAAKVDEVMGHLETAVGFLDKMATYGEGTTAGVVAGFLSFLIDLQLIVGHINTGRDSIEIEALGAAEEFAGGCSTMLGHITNGVNTLNSLPQMDVDFYDTGVGLGGSFIGGMIDGLESASSGLYSVIAGIVAVAIAEAEAAAGVASPSKPMIDLGSMMGEGLALGLGANRADLERAMSGMMADAMAPAYAYAAPGGGQAGNTYNYSYAYNEAAGIGADTRASLRQDFDALSLYERMRG